jgi:hypothetical protein
MKAQESSDITSLKRLLYKMKLYINISFDGCKAKIFPINLFKASARLPQPGAFPEV